MVKCSREIPNFQFLIFYIKTISTINANKISLFFLCIMAPFNDKN